MAGRTPEKGVGAETGRVRELLREKLRQLEAERSSLSAPPSRGEQVQYGKRAGDHVAEVADSLARSRTAGELEGVAAQVQRALAKLDEGSYGRCDACGGAIPAGRLEVLPWAGRCVSCAGRQRPARG
ncbi:MAG: TraR/DksA family transcriptional regulator [Candidatus Dormibacteria bacterium]